MFFVQAKAAGIHFKALEIYGGCGSFSIFFASLKKTKE
jgi:hypothetical protein